MMRAGIHHLENSKTVDYASLIDPTCYEICVESRRPAAAHAGVASTEEAHLMRIGEVAVRRRQESPLNPPFIEGGSNRGENAGRGSLHLDSHIAVECV
jgi:hypothetical protein